MIFFLLLELARAQNIAVRDLSAADFRTVTRELSANSLFSTVTGAETLGEPFSFEVGVVGGLTQTPGIDALAQDQGVNRVPTGVIYGALALPLALTIEGGLLPKVGRGDYQFGLWAAAVKWTPTDLFVVVPFDVGVRAQIGASDLRFRSTVDDVAARADYDGRFFAVDARASKNLGIVTPFVFAGFASATSDMTAEGASVFDPVFAAGQRATSTVGGALLGAGLELHLLTLALGVEYQRALGADRYDAKLGLAF